MNITDKYFTKTIKNMIQNDQCQIISLNVNAGTVHILYTGLFSPNVIICLYTVANGFVPYWNHPNTCRCVKDRYCKNTYKCMSSIKSTNNNTLYNAIKSNNSNTLWCRKEDVARFGVGSTEGFMSVVSHYTHLIWQVPETKQPWLW